MVDQISTKSVFVRETNLFKKQKCLDKPANGWMNWEIKLTYPVKLVTAESKYEW